MTSFVEQKAYSIVKIAELGSFSKAADALCLTQPAISQHVRSVEEDFGVKLFDRDHNDCKLTANGRIVVKYLKRMISLSNNMMQAIRDEKTKVTSISVGITHTVESSKIIEAIADFANKNNNLSIKVLSDSSENLYKMLKNYEIDFMIIDGKINDSSMTHVLLGTDCLALVTSPTHPLATRNVVTIEELKSQSLILRAS